MFSQIGRFLNSFFGLPWAFQVKCTSSVSLGLHCSVSGLVLFLSFVQLKKNIHLCDVSFFPSALLLYFCFAEMNLQVLMKVTITLYLRPRLLFLA